MLNLIMNKAQENLSNGPRLFLPSTKRVLLALFIEPPI